MVLELLPQDHLIVCVLYNHDEKRMTWEDPSLSQFRMLKVSLVPQAVPTVLRLCLNYDSP